MDTLDTRFRFRRGVKGIGNLRDATGRYRARGGFVAGVASFSRFSGLGQDLPSVCPPDTSLTLTYCPPVTVDPGAFACPPSLCPAIYAGGVDVGAAPGINVVALPDGTTVNLVGSSVGFDSASGQNYTLAADGTKIFDDGTVIKPDGSIMLPGGTSVNPTTGALKLPDGSTIAGTATVPTTTTDVLTAINQSVATGLNLANAVATVMNKFGVPTAGAAVQGGRWVSPTQYRMADGTVVTPSAVGNNVYRLPNGQIVGAPPSSIVGGGWGTAALVGGGALALMFAMRGRGGSSSSPRSNPRRHHRRRR